jgi:hypothetical protein
MMDNLEDIIINLFGTKYSKEQKLDALCYLERCQVNGENHTPLLVKKYHPKFYAEGCANPMQSFLLAKALGFI